MAIPQDDETPEEANERDEDEMSSDDVDELDDSAADGDVVGERPDPVERLVTWTEAIAAAAIVEAGKEPEYRVETTYDREFDVPASRDEIASAGEESARLRGEAEVILEKRKHTMKVLKEQAGAKLVEAEPFDTTIRKGTKIAKEPVEVRVVWQMNAKLVVRLSTGDILETRPMTAAEREAELSRRQTTIESRIADDKQLKLGDDGQPSAGAP